MVDKGDATKLETSGNQEEIVPEPGVNPKKRKIGQISIQAGRQAQRQTHPRGENLSKDPVQENEKSTGGVHCGSQQTYVLTCHLSTALSGKFPEDELKAGRELESRNMLKFRLISIGG